MATKNKTKKTVSNDTAPALLKILWEEGYFTEARLQMDVAVFLSKRGYNFPDGTLRMALTRAKCLTRDGILYIQTRPAINKEVDIAQSILFENELIKKLGKTFEKELVDLHHNFGKSGVCTAFLLRKILEKLIYITFAKHGLEKKLEDKNISGRLVGLEAMINITSGEKVGGIPLLTSHTAQEIKGIKFLGDVSAHNPLADVETKTIIPQLPYIITAYTELLR
jgi:hypothetical protein